MKTLNEYVIEGLLGDFDELEKNQDKDMVKQWCEQNFSGEYNVVILKSKKMKLRGNVILKNYEEDSFPFIITELHGNLSIEKCPNITSLKGLFDDVMKMDGNLSINNCQSLNSLEGIPYIIEGSLSITGNRSLKTLDYMPEFINGTVYIMKNGKRFKESDVKNVKWFKRIVCSMEDDEDLINEDEIINEALNEPHLLEFAELLKKHKSDLTSLFRSQQIAHTMPWEKLDSSNVTEYTKIDSKVKTIVRNIISGKEFKQTATRSYIFLKDYNDNYTYIISYKKELLRIASIFQHKTAVWQKYNSTELMEIIEKADSLFIVSIDEKLTSDNYKLRLNRAQSQTGVVQNTPEYYAQVVKDNLKRYRDIIAKKRAAGSISKGDTDFDEMDIKVKKLAEETLTIVSKLNKNSNSSTLSIYDNRHAYRKINKIMEELQNVMTAFNTYVSKYILFKHYYDNYHDNVNMWESYKLDTQHTLSKLKYIVEDLEKRLKEVH